MYSDYEGIVISPWADTTDFLSGMRYGWHVRSVEPYLSPWSVMWSFTPTLCPVEDLVPEVGASGVVTSPVFTWDCPGTVDGYEFMLARDPGYTDVVASFAGAGALSDNSWDCDVSLDQGMNYFWRVRAVRGEALGSWVGGSFTTEAMSGVSTGVPAAPSTIDIPPPESPVRNYLVWAMFFLVALLMAGLIVLVMRTSRR